MQFDTKFLLDLFQRTHSVNIGYHLESIKDDYFERLVDISEEILKSTKITVENKDIPELIYCSVNQFG